MGVKLEGGGGGGGGRKREVGNNFDLIKRRKRS